ncbi:MAG: hypothetical protein K2V38_17785 [Gemmataceae bacterium]|nr:hypothetical protein [Gemmataceae bacterium]
MATWHATTELLTNAAGTLNATAASVAKAVYTAASLPSMAKGHELGLGLDTAAHLESEVEADPSATVGGLWDTSG